MQKCLIFLLALISLSVQARANWTPYEMDHERFMSLDEKDKDTLIIRRMEIMVELESKYAREVKVSGYSFERFQKYLRILNQLQSLILSNAVAAEPVKKFSELVDHPTGCIYGGWASVTELVGEEPVCVHPLKTKNQDIINAYETGNKGCTDKAHISCNPKVFGFKTSANSTPFCVETSPYKKGSESKAHNVSYECMRKSLIDEKGQDTKVQRFDAMKKAMEIDGPAFEDVQKYIFKTCACDSGNMSQDYKAYIRPHRTCYGMMNSLRSFGNKDCSDMVSFLSTQDQKFATDLNKFFDTQMSPLNIPTSKKTKTGDWDKDYEKLIMHDSVKNYCKTLDLPQVETDKKFLCETKCSYKEAVPSGKGKTISCQITKAFWRDGKGVETDATKELESLTIENATDKKTKVKLKDSSEEDCPVDVAEKPAEKNCSITVDDVKDDKTKSVATLSFSGYNDQEKQEAIEWAPAGTTSKEKPMEMVYVKTEADQPLKVTYKITGAPALKEPLSCVSSIPKREKSDDTKPTLEVKAEAAQPTLVKLNATVSLNGKPLTMPSPEGLHLSWFRSKDGGKTIEPFVKPAETTPTGTAIMQTDADKTAAAAAAAAAPTAVVTEGEFSQEESVTEFRHDKAYETCARLIDAKGATVVEKICNPIPALEKEKNNNNNYNQNPNAPQPTFIVPRYNTRQQGIQ